MTLNSLFFQKKAKNYLEAPEESTRFASEGQKAEQLEY
jgi:hypothetical protein